MSKARLSKARLSKARPWPSNGVPSPARFGSFGDDSWIVPPATVVGPDLMHLGTGVVVMEYASLRTSGGRLEIGDGVRLGRFVHISCSIGVTLEPDVSSSDYVAIADSGNPDWGTPHGASAPWPAAPIVIEQGAYLGAGSIIFPGVRVGRGAYIGENAVVLHDVPPHSVVYGNPARITRHLEPGRGWVGEMRP